jgi:tetratricopeptide (TPR) repeat protein
MAKDPQNTSALMLAARIYEIGKDYKKAAEAYEKVLKIEPKDSPALNNVAYLYSEYLNNLDRAYELAQLARQVSPFDPSIADTLGWIDYKRGDYQAALGLLQESAAKLPAVPDIQFHLGMANYMNGNEAKARAALQQAWQTSTNFVGRDECGRSLSILDINPATADAAAVATLEKRVSETPNDTVALVRLARIYQREGNTEKAIAAYESLLQAMPKNLEAMVNLTKLYEAKDPKKAYEMAKTASKAAPYDPNVSHTLGRLAFQAGDYQLATSVLQQTVQNEPNDASLQFDYGRAAYSIGKVAVAQAAFQSALALNLAGPQAQEARRILDLMALAAAPAQAAAAQARIGEALKTDPDDVPALMARAAASEYGSDRAGAEQACEKVLAHYPDFIPAQEQLAWLYMAEPARLDRAYQLAANLHETLPDDYRVTKILGMILVRRGEYSHALNLLQQCAMKTSSDADIFYYMGSAQFHLKDKAESKANLQKALALNLSGPPADSAKQMLSELK